MHATVLTGLRQLASTELPTPQIARPDDVLLRMQVVGVCGSDVHYYTTGRIGSQVVQYPFTVGHEGAATVAAVGSGVRDLRPGDRVAIDPAVPCHACDQCRRGRPHTCRRLAFLGCPGQIAGCLAECIVMPAECLIRIPDGMTFEEAALCEPLAIGLYAVQQSLPMPGAKVGILGLGPIGLSVLLAARHAGAAALYGIDPLPWRRQAARDHGAVWTGAPDDGALAAEIARREPEQLDVVFECCGQQEALDLGLELLRPGGKLMIIGIPEFDRFSFAADVGRRKEVCLQHVRRQNGCAEKAVDLVARGQLRPRFMATHRFTLDQTKQAFDLVDQYADGVIKAMVRIP